MIKLSSIIQNAYKGEEYETEWVNCEYIQFQVFNCECRPSLQTRFKQISELQFVNMNKL